MINIKFDRDSVYIGDDIESHISSFDVDEKTSKQYIGQLYLKDHCPYDMTFSLVS